MGTLSTVDSKIVFELKPVIGDIDEAVFTGRLKTIQELLNRNAENKEIFSSSYTLWRIMFSENQDFWKPFKVGQDAGVTTFLFRSSEEIFSWVNDHQQTLAEHLLAKHAISLTRDLDMEELIFTCGSIMIDVLEAINWIFNMAARPPMGKSNYQYVLDFQSLKPGLFRVYEIAVGN